MDTLSLTILATSLSGALFLLYALILDFGYSLPEHVLHPLKVSIRSVRSANVHQDGGFLNASRNIQRRPAGSFGSGLRMYFHGS